MSLCCQQSNNVNPTLTSACTKELDANLTNRSSVRINLTFFFPFQLWLWRQGVGILVESQRGDSNEGQSLCHQTYNWGILGENAMCYLRGTVE
mmetsp:Transcript_31168/g.57594  ORF Transcript_31168/g.57594 Transcript_31168/m.57594 type:complete len:93 (-) Transcript_31168:37-315(-)